MRIFSILMILVLIAAVIVPMYLRDPSGKPIMSAKDWAPETPQPLKTETPMFKWQDGDGVWQFGESPPAEVAAERVQLDTSRVTPLGDEWNLQPPPPEQQNIDASTQLQRLMELMPR